MSRSSTHHLNRVTFLKSQPDEALVSSDDIFQICLLESTTPTTAPQPTKPPADAQIGMCYSPETANSSGPTTPRQRSCEVSVAVRLLVCQQLVAQWIFTPGRAGRTASSLTTAAPIVDRLAFRLIAPVQCYLLSAPQPAALVTRSNFLSADVGAL